MDALVSDTTISGDTQPVRSTIAVNSGASAGTQGTGGQAFFNDSITNSSRNVNSGSTGQTADSGKQTSSYSTGTGSETTKAPLHIKVKDCPVSVAKVAVLFDGARDWSDTTLLATNGGVTGVVIKSHEDDQNTTVSFGKASKDHPVVAGATVGTGSVDLEFYAGYILTGAVAAGDTNGTTNFSMTYS